VLLLLITLSPVSREFFAVVTSEVLDETTGILVVHKFRGSDYAAAGVDSTATVWCGGGWDRGDCVAALFIVIIISTILAFISLHRGLLVLIIGW